MLKVKDFHYITIRDAKAAYRRLARQGFSATRIGSIVRVKYSGGEYEGQIHKIAWGKLVTGTTDLLRHPHKPGIEGCPFE